MKEDHSTASFAGKVTSRSSELEPIEGRLAESIKKGAFVGQTHAASLFLVKGKNSLVEQLKTEMAHRSIPVDIIGCRY
jgi:hypothetical protein